MNFESLFFFGVVCFSLIIFIKLFVRGVFYSSHSDGEQCSSDRDHTLREELEQKWRMFSMDVLPKVGDDFRLYSCVYIFSDLNVMLR